MFIEPCLETYTAQQKSYI